MANLYASVFGLFAFMAMYPSEWSTTAFCITFVVVFIGIIALEASADIHDAQQKGRARDEEAR